MGTFSFDPSKGETPQSLAEKRQIAQALLASRRPAKDLGSGLSELGNALAFHFMQKKADAGQAAGMASANSAFAPILAAFSGKPQEAPAAAPSTQPASYAPGQIEEKPLASVAPVVHSPVAGASFLPKDSASPTQNQSWLNYDNKGAIRNQPISPELQKNLSFLPDMGISMNVFSGGQDATGAHRTGSHRHDNGGSADVFFSKDGRQLDWRNPDDIPVLQSIVTRAKANGVTGFGAGDGYMQPGSMHIGFGTPSVWGAGGRGSNAPEWLKQAFNSKYIPQASQAPVQVASNDPSVGLPQPASAPPQNMVDPQSGLPKISNPQVTSQMLDSGAPMPGQSQPQQVAQASPQQGGMNKLDMGTLLKIAQDPWVSQDPAKMQIIQSLMTQQMNANDPNKALERRKMAIELKNLEHPDQIPMSAKDAADLKLRQDQFGFEQRKPQIVGSDSRLYGDGKVLLDALPKEEKPNYEITDIGGKRVLVDKNTGNTVKELGDSPIKNQSVPSGYRMSPDGQKLERIPGFRDTNLEMDMRKEFDVQSKDFRSVRDSYNRVQTSAENPSPAGDLSLIFNYMKMLDPSSVVRESEFATAAAAGSFGDRIKGAVSKITNGEQLAPDQRADFLAKSESLYKEQEQTFQSLSDQYSGVAQRNGLSPENILLTPRSNPRKSVPVISDDELLKKYSN